MFSKRLVSGFIIFLSLSNSSCSEINITDFSCEKLSNNSSINIEELLKKPDSITIDGLDFKLGILIQNIDNVGSVRSFPEQIIPVLKNDCSNFAFSYIYSSDGKSISYLNPYIPERIWLLNPEKKVWETSNLSYNNSVNEYPGSYSVKVGERIPNFRSTFVSDAIIKFKYKEKDYFLRYKSNNIY